MIKISFLLCCFLLSACGGKKDDPNSFDLASAQSERDRRIAEMNLDEIARCDYVTFAAMGHAYSSRDFNVRDLEIPSGRWNRHYQICFPNDSKSETSLDGYLSVLHLAQERGDKSLVKRIIDYAGPRDWITGEGPEGVTSIKPLVPIIREMAGRDEHTEERVPNPFEGFRGHLLANYLWLHAKVHGDVPLLAKPLLSALAQTIPGSPYIAALNARYNGASYGRAFDLLNDFSGCAKWWGSCHDSIYYAITVAVLEGR